MSDNNMSRRSFLSLGGAALASGAAMAATALPAVAEEVSWDKEADVVVVGYGGAGSAAAIEAARAGCSVTILEARSFGGGSTIANGGFIMMGATKLQEKFGVVETTENFFNYLRYGAGDNVDDAYIRVLADNASP